MSWLADRILDAEEFTEPWPYIVVHDALEPKHYDILLAEMNQRPTKVTAGRLTRDLIPGNRIGGLIRDPDVREALDEMCGFRGNTWPRVICDVEGFDMKPHTDEEKRATSAGIFQLYMTTETVDGHGTFLWSVDGELAAEIPFESNVAYAFKRGPHSLHSCGPMVSDRWSLLSPFMDFPGARV